jgi:hypothetical protein
MCRHQPWQRCTAFRSPNFLALCRCQPRRPHPYCRKRSLSLRRSCQALELPLPTRNPWPLNHPGLRRRGRPNCGRTRAPDGKPFRRVDVESRLSSLIFSPGPASDARSYYLALIVCLSAPRTMTGYPQLELL